MTRLWGNLVLLLLARRESAPLWGGESLISSRGISYLKQRESNLYQGERGDDVAILGGRVFAALEKGVIMVWGKKGRQDA